MVVVMQEGATEDAIQNVINRLMDMGFDIHRSTGARHTVLGAVGAKVDFDTRNIELLEGVEEVLRITAPYKLASRHFRPEGTLVTVGQGVTIGGEEVVVMAGPCSVENAEQIDTVAASRGGKRRAHPARRSLQAPHFALQFSGDRPARAGTACARLRTSTTFAWFPRLWTRRRFR